MARLSFTLRRTTGGSASVGSYLQYPPSYDASASAGLDVRTYDDVNLRSDGELSLVNPTPVESGIYSASSFFNADLQDYETVKLTWGAPLVSSVDVGSVYVPTAVIVSYSSVGEPDTVREGSILVETTTENEYTHTAPAGQWAYYTLFLKYESLLDDPYYAPAAKVSVLVPTNYGSTDDMYARIPEYYRIEDARLSYPLYNFLSLYGFEVDRLRTLIDYQLICKDPRFSRSEDLDAVAIDLGTDLISNELGTSRLRALLSDIGTIRRERGTISAVESVLTALTGADVTVDEATKEIRISPQRVNLLKDPRNVGATYWSTAAIDGDTTVLYTTNASVYVYPGNSYVFSMHTEAAQSVEKVYFFDTVTSSKVIETTDYFDIAGVRYWVLEVPIDYTDISPVWFAFEYATATVYAIDYLLLEPNYYGDYFDGDTERGGWVVDDSGSVADFQWYGTAGDSYSCYLTNYQKTKATIARLLPDILPVDQLLTTGTAYSNRSLTLNGPNSVWTVVFNYMAA